MRARIYLVCAVGSMLLLLEGCAASVRFGHDDQKSIKRAGACSYWCDTRVDNLEQDEYFGCLERCVEWRCDA